MTRLERLIIIAVGVGIGVGVSLGVGIGILFGAWLVQQVFGVLL